MVAYGRTNPIMQSPSFTSFELTNNFEYPEPSISPPRQRCRSVNRLPLEPSRTAMGEATTQRGPRDRRDSRIRPEQHHSDGTRSRLLHGRRLELGSRSPRRQPLTGLSPSYPRSVQFDAELFLQA